MFKRYTIGCVTSSISYHGGWDTLSKGIVSAVAKHHNVIVLTARNAENDPISYPIHRVLPAKYITYSILNQIWIFLVSLWYFRKCDCVHVFVEPLTPGAALAAKFLRIPLFITIAGTYSVIPTGKRIRHKIKRVMMKFMYSYASLIATGSEYNIKRIEEVVSIKGKWQFVPFGVDPEKYKDARTYPKAEHPFLFTVGAIKPRKGAIYVVRALALLRNEFPDLHYKLGGSYNETAPYVQELKAEIKRLKLEDRVELLGRISDGDLLRYYSTCTAFVLAAQTIDNSFEGFPMVFYEAHSMGAPVISTYGFGSEYVIKNGYNGFLVPQDDHVALAEAIRKIVGNPALREEMSKHGLEEAVRHSWDDIAVHYLNAYDTYIHYA